MGSEMCIRDRLGHDHRAGAASSAPAAKATVVGGLSLRPVNACIRFLPTLDGKALLSVEDLAAIGGELHPVQQAMVECHGSQCGFCTPGFVMTMAACYERHCEADTTPTRQQLADELSGNLCRCTGYRPILDAGQRMFELPVRRLDTAPLMALLQQLRTDAPLHYVAPNPAVVRDGQPRHDHFFAPRTLDELATLRVGAAPATLTMRPRCTKRIGRVSMLALADETVPTLTPAVQACIRTSD